MFAFFGLVQYLDYSAKYSFILKTLTHAVPILVRTMVGIVPIFVAVVLLSICLFSASTRFQNASYAAMNLYSMIQGDELQDVFRDLTSIQMLTGLIFLYTWVFFGMAVITNTFIAIVEQGFGQTKRMSRFQWLRTDTNDQKDEDKKEEPPQARLSIMPGDKSAKGDISMAAQEGENMSMKSGGGRNVSMSIGGVAGD